MPDSIDVFEVTFECPRCGLTAIETTTDLFKTLHQRGCGKCDSKVLKIARCKHIFGDPIPKPEDFFEQQPDEEPEE